MNALGMIETKGLIASIEAADIMKKTASVSLKGITPVGDGLVTVMVEGELEAVRASVNAGAAAAERIGTVVLTHVIPRPDKEVEDAISSIFQMNSGKYSVLEEKASYTAVSEEKRDTLPGTDAFMEGADHTGTKIPVRNGFQMSEEKIIPDEPAGSSEQTMTSGSFSNASQAAKKNPAMNKGQETKAESGLTEERKSGFTDNSTDHIETDPEENNLKNDEKVISAQETVRISESARKTTKSGKKAEPRKKSEIPDKKQSLTSQTGISSELSEYAAMTVSELRAKAREMNVETLSRKDIRFAKKDVLLTAIEAHLNKQ